MANIVPKNLYQNIFNISCRIVLINEELSV